MKNKALQEIQNKYSSSELLDIDNQFPLSLERVCDALNIYVNLSKDMPSNINGKIFKVNAKDYSYQIDINFNNAPRSVRFTIAHELGHYIKHKEYIDRFREILERKDREGYTPEQIEYEKEANLFASELLMPEHYFMENYNKLSREANYDNDKKDKLTKQLSDLFRVSTQAVTHRIIMLGLDCAQ